LREAGREASTTLFVSSQILCEFYSIVTNPRRVSKPRSAADAVAAISGLLGFLHVLPVPARAVDVRLDLLRRHPVTGGDVFDLQIVATMQANGIQRIYTFNTADFAAFSDSSSQCRSPAHPDQYLVARRRQATAQPVKSIAAPGRPAPQVENDPAPCFHLLAPRRRFHETLTGLARMEFMRQKSKLSSDVKPQHVESGRR
jgi:predicted nucleic acid-binding protein